MSSVKHYGDLQQVWSAPRVCFNVSTYLIVLRIATTKRRNEEVNCKLRYWQTVVDDVARIVQSEVEESVSCIDGARAAF